MEQGVVKVPEPLPPHVEAAMRLKNAMDLYRLSVWSSHQEQPTQGSGQP